MIHKLTSRKLWLAIAGVAYGIALSLGANATEIQTIAGGVISLISAVTFIIVEGKIDAERVKNAIEKAQDAVETLNGGDE